MQLSSFKIKFRRLLRLRKKQVAAINTNIILLAEDQLERNFVRKFDRLKPVKRFVAGWLALTILLAGSVVVQTRALDGYYKSLQPAAGGIYREGIVGTYTNASPLYATGEANSAVSKLLFASLFKYDAKNALVGDLAESIQADPTGKRYTVRLKPELVWHDGKPLTAGDVVFTYRTIQNPDVQSPLNVSWQDVSVLAKDDRTVIFELPNPLSSFPYSLTTGLIPQHRLKDVPAASLRSSPFNTVEPIGAGPFRFNTVEVSGNSPGIRQEEVALVPFDDYHGGAPKISSFIIRTFPDETAMLESYRSKDLTAMVGLSTLPDDLRQEIGLQIMSMPLTAANMVFFKTTAGVLQDVSVRQALVAVSDVTKATNGLPKPVLPVRSPLLQSSPGYNPKYEQKYQGPIKAAALLEQAGWRTQSNGIRIKNGQILSFRLYAQNTPEYEKVVGVLRQQWRAIGVDAQIFLQEAGDLNTTVAGVGNGTGHSYDALLYGISLGVDPDEYVYWHSKQADIRAAAWLNFSEYKSAVADAALEAGRTRGDPALRAAKYQPFLQAWQTDAPALGLYQPHFSYVTRGQVFGFDERTLTQPTDRFNSVEQWMIRRTPQPIQ